MLTDSPIIDSSVGSSDVSAPINDTADSQIKRTPKRLSALFTFLILIAAAVMYLTIVNADRFGGFHDDGIYVTTAKALASGNGYRIISLPGEPAETKYPPLYPFLLSLVWRAKSNFPENLRPMICLSVAATLGFLAIVWKYLIDQAYATAGQSTIVVALTAFNSWTIVFSTSAISEMFYAMLSVAALYLADRLDRRNSEWLPGVGAGTLCGLALLTRTSGIVLILAVAVYLVLRRSWKPLLGAVSVALVCVVGWISWTYFNRTQASGVNVAFYTNYLNDVREVVASLQTLNGASKPAVLLTIFGKNLLGLIVVSIPLVCSGLSNVWTRDSHGFVVVMSLFFVLVVFMLVVTNVIRRISSQLRLLYVYLLIYLAIHLATPYTTYDRYLVPVLPFLLLFLVSELTRLFSSVRDQLISSRLLGDRLSGAVAALAALATAGVLLFGYVKGIQLQTSSSAKFSAPAQEEQQLAKWIVSNTDSTDTLICYRDPIYFLRTGRKAARSVPTALIDGALFQARQPTVEEVLQRVRSIIHENHGRYLIVSLDDFDHLPVIYRDSFKELTSGDPATFIPVFESTSGRSTIYRIESSDG